MANSEKSENITPYKDQEFSAFIKLIKNGQVAHWQTIAQILGVDEDTITKWKRTPQAQEAISKGIATALKAMESAGKKDWRMWEAKLKMLGINPATALDVTSGGEQLRTVALVEFVNSDANSKNTSQVS